MTGLGKSMRDASRGLVVVAVALALVAACAPAQAPPPAPKPAAESPASGVGDTARVEQLIEGAKKEGKVVVYYPMDEPTLDALQATFEKKYPFIKVERFRAGGVELVQKILAEDAAGRHDADVLWTSSFRFYGVLQPKNLLQPYLSPERAVYPNDVKDKDGYWVATPGLENVISYNTDVVKDPPKSFQDLADPKWKGKLAYEQTNIAMFDGMAETYGEQKATEILRGIASNQPSLRRGHSLLATQVAAGEMPVSVTTYLINIKQLIDQGAPIEWVRTDLIVSDAYSKGILAKAPHPNAAKLWVDFVLSQEGQGLLTKLGHNSSRPGIETSPPDLFAGRRAYYITPPRGEYMSTRLDQLRNIFGIP
ncbi:MAG: extracellular solute-binding protein [Chloroflexi bacterium]|nr:extracellular solute-binding protein [Chloroflexota bacterium]